MANSLTMLRRQMTREGLPTNTEPAALGRLASSSPPAEEEADGEGEPEDREEDADDRDSSGRLGAVGSALMMTPERRSVFCAIRGVCMPCRFLPSPSPAKVEKSVNIIRGVCIP